MSDRIVVSVSEGVADVRLNRPEKLNALDPAMFAALVDTGEQLKADPSVRAVVLSGEGRGFCSGLDFASFQQMAGDGPRLRIGNSDASAHRITNPGQQAAYVWTELAVPVVVAVHGVALGGGCQIALGGDIRIVAPDARLSVLEIRWGLIPDMTGTQILPGLVGLDIAKELTFSGRMVSGTEAVQLGLATKLSDKPRDDALALAGEIAARSPHAVRHAKALLNMAGNVSLAEGFKAEERAINDLIGSPNQKEAVAAYFEQRDAVYSDPGV